MVHLLLLLMHEVGGYIAVSMLAVLVQQGWVACRLFRNLFIGCQNFRKIEGRLSSSSSSGQAINLRVLGSTLHYFVRNDFGG